MRGIFFQYFVVIFFFIQSSLCLCVYDHSNALFKDIQFYLLLFQCFSEKKTLFFFCFLAYSLDGKSRARVCMCMYVYFTTVCDIKFLSKIVFFLARLLLSIFSLFAHTALSLAHHHYAYGYICLFRLRST